MPENRQVAGTRIDRLGAVALVGDHVRLEPVRREHLEPLLAAAQDEGIFAWYRVDLRTREAMQARIEEQLRDFAAGTKGAYAVVLRASGEVVGSTGFLEIDSLNRSTEVGATWYRRDKWGTKVNPECKLLLMRHAFEDWGALRVWLKTDNMNERSKAAILRLGAKPEGVLRWHMMRRDGTMRDSAYFSVIAPEWPRVKAGLEARLDAP